MAKRLIAIFSLTGIILAGCSSEPTSKPLTQRDCLKENKFKYNDECVKYEYIPQEDLRGVWSEVADEIAKAQGITHDEALRQILQTIEDRQNK